MQLPRLWGYMKPKETTGKNENTHKTGIGDIGIEGIKAIKELAIHAVDSETLSMSGKVNIIVAFGFIICIFIRCFRTQIDIPAMFYIFIAIAMISCMISSTSLYSKRSKENRLQ